MLDITTYTGVVSVTVRFAGIKGEGLARSLEILVPRKGIDSPTRRLLVKRTGLRAAA
jgi:hypothetical protein